MRRLLFLLLLLLPLPLPAWADRFYTSGFETNNLSTVETEWNGTVVGSPATVTTPVHSGTYALEIGGAAAEQIRRSNLGAKTSGTLWYREYVRTPSSFTVNTQIMAADDSAGATAFTVELTSGAQLSITNSISANTATSSGTLSTSTWYRIEVQHVISDSVGSLTLKFYLGEDTAEIETLTPTGTDTLPTTVGRFILGDPDTSMNTVQYDDIAINDNAGTEQNSYPGPGKVALVEPASDNTVTWTMTGAGCTGTTRANCVDDTPGAPDDATSYNATSTANNTDRLNKTALPAEVPSDANMVLIQVWGRWGGAGTTGTRQGRMALWDETGTQTLGTTHNLCDVASGTWGNTTPAQLLRLYLGTRTKADVDDADFDLGYQNLNSAECRMTTTWANVEWTETVAPTGCGTTIALTGAGCK